MKLKIIFYIIILINSIFFSCRNTIIFNENKCINNHEKAIFFADSIWRNIYGNRIDNNRPFKAKIINDSIWVIEGSIYTQKGGVPYAEINANTCEVIKITHGK